MFDEVFLEVDDIDYAAIGRRIRSARKKAKLTQEQLAEKIDVTPQHVSAIETGKTKLSLPALIRISKAVNVSLDFLVYDEIPYLIEQYDLDAKEILDSCSTSIERQYLLDTMRLLHTMRLLQDELKNNYILKEKRSKK